MSDHTQRATTDRDTVLRRVSLFLTITALVMTAAMLTYFLLTPNLDIRQTRQEIGVSHITDYSMREIVSEAAPLGIQKEYRFILDKTVDRDAHLAFYTVHQYAEVFLDGQPVYSLMPSGENRVGRTVGSNWIMIPLYREDAGKEVCIVITPVYESSRNWKMDFMLGSQLRIFLNRLCLDSPQLILGIIAVFFGLMFLCISGHQIIFQKKHSGSLVDLGLFSVMLGRWRMMDTRFTAFVIPKYSVFLSYAAILMLMFGMIPLIRSAMAWRKDRRILEILCIALVLAGLVQEVLQIANLFDFREMLIVTHIAIMCSVFVLLSTSFYERRKFPFSSGAGIWNKLPFLCLVGGVSDITVFYIRKTSSGLIFSLATLILYTVFMGISFVIRFGRQEELIQEQESELENSRIAITLSQIQPHFLYNSLTAISDLCNNAPEAREALSDFSSYLRGNMDSLTRKKQIHFTQELDHIKTYLRLEKLRFGDMLQIEYDIQCEDFLLPPLTVQPLVENAVKHGVCQKKQGGTVILRTRREGDTITITVKDDGVGFDPDQPPADGRSHVGVQNVRSRLQKMAGGELTIQSTPGAGSTAVITLHLADS